jgi:biofilm PGA synthesis lipoprotein PgaB
MRPDIHTARNLYASVVLDPVSEQWFAQNPQAFAQGYDHVALMAMPYMEKAANPKGWLQALVTKLPPAIRAKTVFELQSRDWHADKPLPTAMLVEQMQLLANAGVRNFGYYPDDFVGGNPDLNLVFPAISLSTYPYRPKGARDLSGLYSGARIP